MARSVWYGSTVARYDGSGWVDFTGIVDGFDNESSREESDLTLLADGQKVIRCVSDRDEGEMTLTIALDDNDENTWLDANYEGGDLVYLRITYANSYGPVKTAATISKRGESYKKREMMVRNFTFRRTGLMSGESIPA